MEKEKVLSRRSIASALPLSKTLITIIALDFYNINDFICGVIAFILFIVWCYSIHGIITEKKIHLEEIIKENKL